MRARRLGPHLRAVLARKWAERPNRGEGPFVLAGNTRSLRATRPLMKTRGSLTPFEMTLCKWFENTEKFKLYHYQNSENRARDRRIAVILFSLTQTEAIR